MYVPTVCVCVYVCVHPPPILQGVSGKVQTSVEQSPGRTERTGRRRAVSMERERTKEEKENRIESKRHKEIERLGKISSKSDKRETVGESSRTKRETWCG